ncbi:MAG: hypothetical protein WCH75_22705 [Candidatus Binatia bacterium]
MAEPKPEASRSSRKCGLGKRRIDERESTEDRAGAGCHEQQTETRRADLQDVAGEHGHELGIGFGAKSYDSQGSQQVVARADLEVRRCCY